MKTSKHISKDDEPKPSGSDKNVMFDPAVNAEEKIEDKNDLEP